MKRKIILYCFRGSTEFRLLIDDEQKGYIGGCPRPVFNLRKKDILWLLQSLGYEIEVKKLYD